jgi:hypothetical protein
MIEDNNALYELKIQHESKLINEGVKASLFDLFSNLPSPNSNLNSIYSPKLLYVVVVDDLTVKLKLDRKILNYQNLFWLFNL